ncbi:hypothetical protein [Pararobbsia silviterrae]|uniref:Uncharacterized protein n=1 Tax=Pararobbsia silviterrae TaxID=1792498 RepID=A0A494XV09_9BURK|nr:hypothetical protein [Pararobbsia silviterrae]RKP51934.1 hypothetical protein D7S86_18520 [Pararobbsia silviterrae]
MSANLPYLPTQLRASVSLELPRDSRGTVTLVHLDPPFYTFAVNEAVVYTGPATGVEFQVEYFRRFGKRSLAAALGFQWPDGSLGMTPVHG